MNGDIGDRQIEQGSVLFVLVDGLWWGVPNKRKEQYWDGNLNSAFDTYHYMMPGFARSNPEYHSYTLERPVRVPSRYNPPDVTSINLVSGIRKGLLQDNEGRKIPADPEEAFLQDLYHYIDAAPGTPADHISFIPGSSPSRWLYIPMPDGRFIEPEPDFVIEVVEILPAQKALRCTLQGRDISKGVRNAGDIELVEAIIPLSALKLTAQAEIMITPNDEQVLGGEPNENMETEFIDGEMRNGFEYIAGSDAGIGYNDGINEDRVVVSPKSNEVTVIDGMGGHEGGGIAAQIIAEELYKNPQWPFMQRLEATAQALRYSAANYGERLFGKSDAGAAVIHVGFPTENEAEVHWAGDARVVVIGADGKVKYVSEDQSAVQKLVRLGSITEDQAIVHDHRNAIYNAVNAEGALQDVQHATVPVEPGDRILLMSDGVSDNLTPEELGVLSNGRTTKEFYARTVAVTTQRMNAGSKFDVAAETKERKAGTRATYSDGYRSKPKKDNRAFAVIEVPAKNK